MTSCMCAHAAVHAKSVVLYDCIVKITILLYLVFGAAPNCVLAMYVLQHYTLALTLMHVYEYADQTHFA